MFKLYQFTTCPFCFKVSRAIKKMGLKEGEDFELVKASRSDPGRDEVIRLGGRSQVPFLVDGDVNMYESSDIIKYIKDKYASLD